MISGNNNTFFFNFQNQFTVTFFWGHVFLYLKNKDFSTALQYFIFNVVFNQFDYYIM